jgi:L-rhamnose-H+ transport protein
MAGTSGLLMKYAKQWTLQHVWLLYNALALLIIPFFLLCFSSLRVLDIYRTVPAATLVLTIVLGLGWGIGSILSGIGYTMLGIGLGMSVVLGLAAVIGSILPLLLVAPSHLWNSQTTVLYWSIIVLVVGLLFVARAGNLREVSRNPGTTTNAADLSAFGRGELRKGLLIAVSSGILSGLFNLGLVCGSMIRVKALQFGASSASAVNVLWFPITTAGFLGILLYSSYLITRENTWRLYLVPRS